MIWDWLHYYLAINFFLHDFNSSPLLGNQCTSSFRFHCSSQHDSHAELNLYFYRAQANWCLSQQDHTLTLFLKDYTILHQFSNDFEQNTILFHFSGFVFLRLICPAILNPRMFNIISGDYVLQIESILYAAGDMKSLQYLMQ